MPRPLLPSPDLLGLRRSSGRLYGPQPNTARSPTQPQDLLQDRNPTLALKVPQLALGPKGNLGRNSILRELMDLKGSERRKSEKCEHTLAEMRRESGSWTGI